MSKPTKALSTSRGMPASEGEKDAGSQKSPARRWIRRIFGAGLLLAAQISGCVDTQSNGRATDAKGDGPSQSTRVGDLANLREKMVGEQLEARGIADTRVLAAMRAVPRHLFAPDIAADRAYADRPHPIGQGQTISQPYIVALMTELASLRPPCKVLEVGTGSGYQAAVLAELGCTVYTIEIVEPLARQAERILAETGFSDRVHGRSGDGYRGWPEHAPYDAVLVTAAAPRIPQPLLDQLRVGGRLVIPVGEPYQMLEVHQRTEEGFVRERTISVRFVPMTGEVRRPAK